MRTCPNCQGKGQIIRTPCKVCSGAGRTEKEKALEIKIPAGVETGSRLRVTGEGEAGVNGGPAGDLFVVLHVKEHETFERQGANLYSAVPISFAQAALGTEIKVKTLDGEEDLKIPAGTQSEKLMRLRNKGLPDINGSLRGSQYVKIHVHTPENLSAKEIEVLKELERVQEKDHPKSFFQKAKTFFT